MNIIQQEGPLTQNEIKKSANFRLNRITIFRCLRLFINKGIIIRLQDDDGVHKYFLNNEKQTDYVHFKCSHCSTLYPLSNAGIRYNSLPKGFIVSKRNLFMVGICKKCKAVSKRFNYLLLYCTYLILYLYNYYKFIETLILLKYLY